MNIRTDVWKSKEALAIAGGLVVAAIVYALLIHPSMQLNSQHDQALTAKQEAEDELHKLHNQFQQTQQDIQAYKQKIGELGGSPPAASMKDVQIARVTALAHNCKIEVDQYSPIDTWNKPGYQELYLRFSGRGKFQSFQTFMQRLESEIDFVDVTHFAITLVVTDGPRTCMFNWACRINGMLNEEPPGETNPQPKVTAARTNGNGAT